MTIFPSWTADQAATIQALATIVALVIAIGVPWWQRHTARADDKKDRAKELAGIRQALHTEIGMVARQCMLELQSWLDTAPPPVVKNIRTARLPPLTLVAAISGKIGLLTRAEIVELVGFAGILKDIDVVVSDMAQKQEQSQYDRQTIEVLLSNACGNAAKFLEAVPGIEGADKDRQFIAALKAAHKRMDGARKANHPPFHRGT